MSVYFSKGGLRRMPVQSAFDIHDDGALRNLGGYCP
jgi:hypothetical protein